MGDLLDIVGRLARALAELLAYIVAWPLHTFTLF